ncbi:unnamed protein product, partial [Amoebophrya sp. A120]|eukprot:GSA120T00012499001.1
MSNKSFSVRARPAFALAPWLVFRMVYFDFFAIASPAMADGEKEVKEFLLQDCRNGRSPSRRYPLHGDDAIIAARGQNHHQLVHGGELYNSHPEDVDQDHYEVLNHNWTLFVSADPNNSTAGPIKAEDKSFVIENVSLPSDVVSEVAKKNWTHGHDRNIFFERNWLVHKAQWTEQDWVYQKDVILSLPGLGTSRSGTGTASFSPPKALLVFDGIKMFAEIFVNGRKLAEAKNQFLRYVVDLQDVILAEVQGTLYHADHSSSKKTTAPSGGDEGCVNNTMPTSTASVHEGDHNNYSHQSNITLRVEVRFPKSKRGAVHGRFMACSGGWDWAPYSQTFTGYPTLDGGGANNGASVCGSNAVNREADSAMFTFGLWKAVYLVHEVGDLFPKGSAAIAIGTNEEKQKISDAAMQQQLAATEQRANSAGDFRPFAVDFVAPTTFLHQKGVGKVLKWTAATTARWAKIPSDLAFQVVVEAGFWVSEETPWNESRAGQDLVNHTEENRSLEARVQVIPVGAGENRGPASSFYKEDHGLHPRELQTGRKRPTLYQDFEEIGTRRPDVGKSVSTAEATAVREDASSLTLKGHCVPSRDENGADKTNRTILSKNRLWICRYSFFATDVDLWWPRALWTTASTGEKSSEKREANLYDLHFEVSGNVNLQVRRRFGFRHFALRTEQEEEEQGPSSSSAEGTAVVAPPPPRGSGRGPMFLEVNGKKIVARGANFVPTESLESRLKFASKTSGADELNAFSPSRAIEEEDRARYDRTATSGLQDEMQEEQQATVDDSFDSSGALPSKIATTDAQAQEQTAYRQLRGPSRELSALRPDKDPLLRLLDSAVAVNMNTLRIWGGGVFLPQRFYDYADELGLLLYHDLMFVDQDNHCPVLRDENKNASTSVKQELQYQVRRLSRHPSLVIWNACNECVFDITDDQSGLLGQSQSESQPAARSAGSSSSNIHRYIDFAMTIVAATDPSRAIWPSSPSKYGWAAGVERDTSRPVLGEKLEVRRGDVVQSAERTKADGPANTPLESHGPYLHGSGFDTINAESPAVVEFDVGIPLVIHLCRDAEKDHGTLAQGGDSCRGAAGTLSLPEALTNQPSQPPGFVSEFGSSTMSSFETLSPLLRKEHWSLEGGNGTSSSDCNVTDRVRPACAGENPMSQRNYACRNLLEGYFGDRNDRLELHGKTESRSSPVVALSTEEPERTEQNFRLQLYLCALGQALRVTTWIDQLRFDKSVNGMLLWQLNEIWPTGGWGSLEYGGGWKILHHWLQNFAFRDVFVACGVAAGKEGESESKADYENTKDSKEEPALAPSSKVKDVQKEVICYVRNDSLEPVTGLLHLRLFSFRDQAFVPPPDERLKFSLPAGPGALVVLKPKFGKYRKIDGRSGTQAAASGVRGKTTQQEQLEVSSPQVDLETTLLLASLSAIEDVNLDEKEQERNARVSPILLPERVILFAPPKQWIHYLPPEPNVRVISVTSEINDNQRRIQGGDGPTSKKPLSTRSLTLYRVTLQADAVALYVTLSLSGKMHDVFPSGVFSDNGFLLFGNTTKEVTFLPTHTSNTRSFSAAGRAIPSAEKFARSLRIQYLSRLAGTTGHSVERMHGNAREGGSNRKRKSN